MCLFSDVMIFVSCVLFMTPVRTPPDAVYNLASSLNLSLIVEDHPSLLFILN